MSPAPSAEDLRRAVKAAVRVVADFPSPGVNFRDISAAWEQQPELFRLLVDEIARPFRDPEVSARVGPPIGQVGRSDTSRLLRDELRGQQAPRDPCRRREVKRACAGSRWRSRQRRDCCRRPRIGRAGRRTLCRRMLCR